MSFQRIQTYKHIPLQPQTKQQPLMNVVLDLDSTCIFAVPFDELNKVSPEVMRLPYIDHYEFGRPLYRIFERPHLQEFLTFLFEHYNVAVWTAAEYNYGYDIVQRIIIKNKPARRNKLKFFWSRLEFEEAGALTNRTKPLELIYRKFPQFNACNTYIVDDNALVKKSNMDNCIHIKAFMILTEKGAIINPQEVLKDKSLLGVYQQLEFHRGLGMTNIGLCWNW